MNSIIKTRIGSKEDIEGVLLLQEKYLYRNLSENERKDGFVTTPFTVLQIEEILEQSGLFVAENDMGEIVAYAFAGSWEYFKQWDLFRFMIDRFPTLSFMGKEISTENTFQYGPVCIDKKYRGQGVLHLIFEEMRLEFVKKYPISLTFINKVNAISEKAHVDKLGWEIVDRFEFNDKSYLGLAYDMGKSAIDD